MKTRNLYHNILVTFVMCFMAIGMFGCSSTLEKADSGKPNIVLTGSGTVSSTGPVTVTPTMEMVLDGSMDLTLRLG